MEMSPADTKPADRPAGGTSGTAGNRPPSLGEALPVWTKIGVTSFGGPAGQIALMHRELVEERGWMGHERFLHALNFCMLLPGPEAMQLATYVAGASTALWAGWLRDCSSFCLAPPWCWRSRSPMPGTVRPPWSKRPFSASRRPCS